ncbi:A disintegrin and metalloproteinase with thrombospondin motifs 16-like isoform X2 [Tachypleus tridentatus]|uniref:A disintegrin and metalloproteinase with thrombospondin motifs 16-like isoform X2 n=1 Tax=Tachypleus tridentatus TaxID=6853 RepID=UPI003FD5E8BB
MTLRGIIETETDTFTIHPLPGNVTRRLGYEGKRLSPHLVVKAKSSELYSCPHGHIYHNIRKRNADAFKLFDGPKSRRERSTARRNPVIETAVFTDESFYHVMRRAFPTDTDQHLSTYVLAVMNAVQLLFKDSSLGNRSPDLTLVLLDILRVQPSDLEPSHDIDTYLTNFCIWQHRRRGTIPLWDHALLLSGINMYVLDKNGRRKRHVVGLAPVSGMCNSLNSCTISEGTSFQTVHVATHEMGHSLGMEHDGSQDGNNCNPSKYIMSPTLGSGKSTWSHCSREYLEKFLRSSRAECLTAEGPYPDILKQKSREKLPGELYDADRQCALHYGSRVQHSSTFYGQDICKNLRCETGFSHSSSVSAHPALEGTTCGVNMWCRSGKCISRDQVVNRPQPIDGAWSSWSAYSSCSSDCMTREGVTVVGVMISRRRCDNPRPSNGGRFCDGEDRRVKLCDVSRLCYSSSKPSSLNDFISNTCQKASEVNSNIGTSGTQFPNNDESHSCYVWCHKRGGGYMTQGWEIPNGAPCWRHGERHNSRYCVDGQCQAFDCDGYSTPKENSLGCPASSGFRSFSGQHGGISSASSSNRYGSAVPHGTDKHYGGSSALNSTPYRNIAGWKPISQCKGSCIFGSKGLQVVKKDCRSQFYCLSSKETIRLCDDQSQSCRSKQSVDQYASEVCQRYKKKYPTLLSGRGQQLSSRPGNPDSACMVACQDKVWLDTHYQMDVFDDGKFPAGTDCSGGDSHVKSYCLDGKCVTFNKEETPQDDDDSYVSHVKHLFRIKRHLQKQELLTYKDDKTRNFIELRRPFTPISHVKPGFDPLQYLQLSLENSNMRRMEPFVWSIVMSECSAPCGGGVQQITLECHKGHLKVEDEFCNSGSHPRNSLLRPCNTHPCTGSWQIGEWGPCSATCGLVMRSRVVLCVKQVMDKVLAIVENIFCPLPVPADVEKCKFLHC